MKCNLIAAIFIIFGTFVHAQTNISLGGFQPDTQAPVEITSNSLTLDQDTEQAQFSGSVEVRQGSNVIATELMTVTYDEATGNIILLEATGGVTFVTKTDAAEALSATYDLKNNTLRMTGNVLLTQGISAIGAESMFVDLATGKAQLEGRVRTTLVQQDDQ